MKRLAVAMMIVLAFSSAALALNYQNVGVTLSGTNTFINGDSKITALHNNTLKINGSGTGWTANAEFTANSGGGTSGVQSNGTFTLNDLYVKLSNQPFTFEVWNWGEDGQGVDFTQAPIGFVRVNDAPDASWMARLTTNAGGNDTVLNIKNPHHAVTPDYTLFTKRSFGATTFGAAYRTSFNHRNITDGWASTEVAGVKLHGEVAKVTIDDESDYAFGAKVVLPQDITVLGYVSPKHVWDRENYSTNPYKTIYEDAPSKNYLEVNAFQLYRGTYTVEQPVGKDDKVTYDLRLRTSNKSGSAAIGDIFVVDNDFFDINVTGDNDWLKTSGYAAGVTYVDDKSVADPTKTTTIYAQAAPFANLSVYAKVVNVNPETADDTSQILLRGFYRVNDTVTIHPRVFVNARKPVKSSTDNMDNGGNTTGTTDVAYAEDTLTVGSYFNYKVATGQLQAALWQVNDGKAGKDDSIIELGYELSF